uniref:hypothetical protein n=1 Tax=Prevotella sp. TaxID=59823 RepID=UPI004026C195
MMMTGSFIRGVAYVLAAILILGALNQLVTLGGARRYARTPSSTGFSPLSRWS